MTLSTAAGTPRPAGNAGIDASRCCTYGFHGLALEGRCPRQHLIEDDAQGILVQLVVHTRKFFCDNIRCLRRIFTETFPGVLAPYARRTKRMGQALLELAHSSNAESAAWVGGFLGYPTSPDTLLRCQRQEPIHTPTPRVLGVDEFALRRGCTYAAILVDQERHQPVDILEGKQAEPLTQWLRDHPGVDILTRDRAEAYALAGRTGAPAAQQVADRFHLVHNVGEALKKLVRSQRWIVLEPETVATRAPPDPIYQRNHPRMLSCPSPRHVNRPSGRRSSSKKVVDTPMVLLPGSWESTERRFVGI